MIWKKEKELYVLDLTKKDPSYFALQRKKRTKKKQNKIIIVDFWFKKSFGRQEKTSVNCSNAKFSFQKNREILKTIEKFTKKIEKFWKKSRKFQNKSKNFQKTKTLDFKNKRKEAVKFK